MLGNNDRGYGPFFNAKETMEQVYIYLYSEVYKVFESNIEKACNHYNLFELRARANSQRVIKMYTLLCTQQEVDKWNKLLEVYEEEKVLEEIKGRTLVL